MGQELTEPSVPTRRLRVTLVRSLIDQKPGVEQTCRALGLRRRGASRLHRDEPAIRGMIFKVKHLVKVEEL
ncbi:MAG: 50S ribosomal protein L30 [candidate division WOR-3 bacterium]